MNLTRSVSCFVVYFLKMQYFALQAEGHAPMHRLYPYRPVHRGELWKLHLFP
uniref:Uncharacterized protein n=1 Tax=Anguilla anguilla TaxID=7936 RepID=A0A0E9R7N4_ANGAN